MWRSMQISRRELLARAMYGIPALSALSWGCRQPPATGLVQLSMQSPWVNDAEFIGYFIAIDQEYYRDVGLDVKYLRGGPEIIAEGRVLSRQADLALAPLETTASFVLKERAPFRIIGTQYQKSPMGIVT